jgi:hypothetical protein
LREQAEGFVRFVECNKDVKLRPAGK